MKAGIVSPRIRRITKKRLAKEKLEKEKKLVGKIEEEIEVIINNEVALEDSHPRGEKPKYFGELNQMDDSSHLWLGEKKSCLHLINVFVPKFNTKFVLDYKKFKSVYETSPSEEKINYTRAILSPRKIDNGNSIKYKNQYYQPYENGKLKCFKPKAECLVIKDFNGQLLVIIDDKVYELRELQTHEKYSKEFDVIPMPKKSKSIFHQ